MNEEQKTTCEPILSPFTPFNDELSRENEARVEAERIVTEKAKQKNVPQPFLDILLAQTQSKSALIILFDEDLTQGNLKVQNFYVVGAKVRPQIIPNLFAMMLDVLSGKIPSFKRRFEGGDNQPIS